MKNRMEQFISMISCDAINRTVIWKPVALMLPDSLVHLLSGIQVMHVAVVLDKVSCAVQLVRGLKRLYLTLSSNRIAS
jgi:hypothetical protein